MPAEVPGCAAEVLRSAHGWSLDQPARRFDAEEWWYRLRFAAPAAAEAAQRIVLGFDGLATIADAWLNGEPLLHSENMFVAHECDVTGRLLADNELMLRFAALDPHVAMRRPRPRWRVPMVEQQQLRWIRTTLLGRTPGWSPPAAVVGPWQDIWIEQRRSLELRALTLRATVPQPGIGCLEVACELAPLGQARIEAVVLELSRQGKNQQLTLQPSGAAHFEGRLPVDDVALWWPHTHGEPALYECRLKVQAEGAWSEVHAGRIGFRTIELDTDEGRFSLRVNGIPVFCRGASWMPVDPVRLHGSPSVTAEAVRAVRHAGMNMLRISGTSVYESDAFLDACDEHGILLWQDFMFASMDYPEDDDAFAESVQQEVRQQLQRLHAHPCLAVLCGNSEVEQQAAMWGVERSRWSPRLFHQDIADLAQAACPCVPYWPSSAHGGAFPHQVDRGTTSYFGFGAYLRPVDDVRRSSLSFATECLAFANIPDDTTLARMPGGLSLRAHHAGWKARSPRDLGAGWDFDDVRDHYLAQAFKVEPLQLRYSNHDRYLALSRVLTGELMAQAYGEWRRAGSRCGGALVWFLRDLWAGAGWGLIDDAGRAKPCLQILKRALQPRCVWFTDEGCNGLYVHVSNERPEPWRCELALEVFRHDDACIAAARRPLELPPHASIELAANAEFETLLDLSHAFRFATSEIAATVATLRDEDGTLVSQSFHFTDRPLLPRGDDPRLSAVAEPTAGGWLLRLRSQRLAQWVHVDAEGYLAQDDYLHLAPGCERRIELQRCGNPPARQPAGWVRALGSQHPTRIEWQAA